MNDSSAPRSGDSPASENDNQPHEFSRRTMLGVATFAALGLMTGGSKISGAETAAEIDNARAFEIVILVYAKGTMLDFAGPNEVFQKLENARIRYVSVDGGPVTLEHGLVFGPTGRLSDVKACDLLLVPGGPDLAEPMKPENLKQIRRLADNSKYVTSVCTGSLVLAATGILEGKRSACHWACLNLLKDYGAIPDPARFVKDGRFLSGGGVTSGIDFALHVVAELRGPLEAQFIQLSIEYDPEPPFKAGHPRVASRELLDMAEKHMPGSTRGLYKIAQ